jgi:hypothetical protein
MRPNTRRHTGLSCGLFFRLRNLLSTSGVFLPLAFNVRLRLFLRRLLVFGFWRFIAHEPNAKV